MKTHIVHLKKAMKNGDKFTLVTKQGKYQFIVMAVEIYPKGINTYWVAPMLKVS